MNRPLLVVDGDSFAHRSYHALPKSIRRSGDKGGGAIVGFANFLLRLYAQEEPRAVLVGWDTLDAPTYRHRALAGYQAGRVVSRGRYRAVHGRASGHHHVASRGGGSSSGRTLQARSTVGHGKAVAVRGHSVSTGGGRRVAHAGR